MTDHPSRQYYKLFRPTKQEQIAVKEFSKQLPFPLKIDRFFTLFVQTILDSYMRCICAYSEFMVKYITRIVLTIGGYYDQY